jgi:DinB superfamily
MTDHIQNLLSRLSDGPARIARAIAWSSAQALREAPSGEDWSAVQILAHVRASDDILAYRAYALLVRDDGPLLPVFDERKWAEVVGYADVDFLTSLQTFTLRRAELVNMLRRAAPDNWNRSGIRESLGPISLLDVVTTLVEHEEEHCLQLEASRHLRS